MKHPRMIYFLLIALFTVQSTAFGWMKKKAKDDKDEKTFEIPTTRPEISEDALSTLKNNKIFSELIATFTRIDKLQKEIATLKEQADDEEKNNKKNEKEIAKSEKKLELEKKEIIKIGKKLRRPLDKELEKLQKKHDEFKEKANQAEAKKKEKLMEKFNNEADKLSEQMDKLKLNIDFINYYLCFEGAKSEDDATAEDEQNTDDGADGDTDDDQVKSQKDRKKNKK